MWVDLLGFGCFLFVELCFVEIGSGLEWGGVFWGLVAWLSVWGGLAWQSVGLRGGSLFVVEGCCAFAEGDVGQSVREEAWNGSVISKVSLWIV